MFQLKKETAFRGSWVSLLISVDRTRVSSDRLDSVCVMFPLLKAALTL